MTLLHNRFAEIGEKLSAAKGFNLATPILPPPRVEIPSIDYAASVPNHVDVQDTADAAAVTVVALADLYQLSEKSVAAQEALISHTISAGHTSRRFSVAILVVGILTLLVGVLAVLAAIW